MNSKYRSSTKKSQSRHTTICVLDCEADIGWPLKAKQTQSTTIAYHDVLELKVFGTYFGGLPIIDSIHIRQIRTQGQL